MDSIKENGGWPLPSMATLQWSLSLHGCIAKRVAVCTVNALYINTLLIDNCQYHICIRVYNVIDWITWDQGKRLNIPIVQGFNTKDMANAGYVYSNTINDPYMYLLFAGTTERTSYEKRYCAQIKGLIWSPIAYVLYRATGKRQEHSLWY